MLESRYRYNVELAQKTPMVRVCRYQVPQRVTSSVYCREGEESATVQVVVQLMAKHTGGTVRQTPRAEKLRTGKIYHMDSLPLFLDADDEINTLEQLPMIKRLMMLQVLTFNCLGCCDSVVWTSLVN